MNNVETAARISDNIQNIIAAENDKSGINTCSK
jgi:hypothetical protein